MMTVDNLNLSYNVRVLFEPVAKEIDKLEHFDDDQKVELIGLFLVMAKACAGVTSNEGMATALGKGGHGY